MTGVGGGGWGPPAPASGSVVLAAGAAPQARPPPGESLPLKPLRESAQPAANDHRMTFLSYRGPKKGDTNKNDGNIVQ